MAEAVENVEVAGVQVDHLHPSQVRPEGVNPVPPRVPRPASLHVSSLAPTTTESNLFDFFRVVGENIITSIRVCRDHQTRESLGYAYVNFNNSEDAAKAIEALQYEEIDGRCCIVNWSKRDPSQRKSNVGNLFVKNLDKEIDHQGLYETFENFGEIVSCKVACDFKTGASNGYGFVQFASEEQAKLASEALHGKCLNGKEIFVGPFIPRVVRGAPSNRFTNIFLKNLNRSLTPERFSELLIKATQDLGLITSPFLKRLSQSDGSISDSNCGFGFVNFESPEVAQKALARFQDAEKIAELAPELISEEPLFANPALPRKVRQQMFEETRQHNRNLYVKNIAESVTEEQLREVFRPHGEITSLKIMVNEDASSVIRVNRGFGFVCYATDEASRAALTNLNGFTLENKPLYVAIAQKREVRSSQLAQQFAMQRRPVGPAQPYAFNYPPMMVRGPNPAFAAGRNVPRRPPQPQQAFPPRMFPQSFPQRISVPPGELESPDARYHIDVRRAEEIQQLGDNLYKIIHASENEDYRTRQIVGTILGDIQKNTPPESQIAVINNILRDPVALNQYYSKAKDLFHTA